MTSPCENANDFLIRWFTIYDADQVYHLCRKSEDENFWEYEDFSRLTRMDPPGGLVAAHPETGLVAAFLAYCVRDKDHRIMRLVVDKEHRGKGLGHRLLETVASLQGLSQRDVLSCVVRESNLQAQLYLKRRGFRCTKTQPGIFECPPEAGYLFVRRRDYAS